MRSKLCILVRGSNDIGSAVAHRLFCAGYMVVLHDLPTPAVTRRRMAFTDAIFDGHAVLESMQARRVDDLSQLRDILKEPCFIPIVIDDFTKVRERFQPHILVDARMRKHDLPEPQRGLAQLTIGLGPNFIVGETTDLAVETGWGDSLGKVIKRGATMPLEGEPKSIQGHARDRYVYAPLTGIFHTRHQIGDAVTPGMEIAHIEATPLDTPIGGILRGLTHNGVPVSARAKVIEIDPRLELAQISGITERPACIAEGVLQAIRSWENHHAH